MSGMTPKPWDLASWVAKNLFLLTHFLPYISYIHRCSLHASEAEFGFHLSWSLHFPIHPFQKDPPGKRGFFSTARRVQGWLSASSCALAGSHPERSSTGYCHSWQVGGWQKCAMKVAGKSGSGKKENPWNVWDQNHFTIFLIRSNQLFFFHFSELRDSVSIPLAVYIDVFVEPLLLGEEGTLEVTWNIIHSGHGSNSSKPAHRKLQPQAKQWRRISRFDQSMSSMFPVLKTSKDEIHWNQRDSSTTPSKDQEKTH